jgi:ATP adenylyltransferase
MEHLWAPWRVTYIESKKPAGCILCDKPKENNDEANYILFRGELNFVILNAFPYNPGHLMVAPYRHIPTPEEMTAEELCEHYEIVTRVVKVLREAYNPAGFNTGMNIGKVAGAGIDGHIHSHIVPRWQGDTNFMPVLGDVRVIPQALDETYRKLKGKF